MTSTHTLHLACPTCSGDIEIEYVLRANYTTDVISLRTWCFCSLSRQQAYALLMDEGARQAELATERAVER